MTGLAAAMDAGVVVTEEVAHALNELNAQQASVVAKILNRAGVFASSLARGLVSEITGGSGII